MWRRVEGVGGSRYEGAMQGIPVQLGHRPAPVFQEQRMEVRRTIIRSIKLVQALSVPKITLYNVRSAWAKWDNLSEDIQMRETDVMFLTEVWEKLENRKHQKAIENLLELKGLKYISIPRPGARRGGGTALISAENNFRITKLKISIPHPLEACFALLRPRNPTGKITKFICISFYSPPKLRSNKKLIEFLISTVAQLRSEHPNCGIVMGDDVNDLKLPLLLAYDPSLKQIVRGFTNKNRDKLLDCLITTLHSLLQEPTILPPIQVDPGKTGKDSDHMGVECVPRNHLVTQGCKLREKVVVQPLPESGLVELGFTLMKECWEGVEESMSSSEMVMAFEEHSRTLVDKQFPKKMVFVEDNDLPYFSEDLRKLKRQRQRASGKGPTVHGRRSGKYVNLREKFNSKLKREALKYVDKIKKEVAEGVRGSGYKAVRKLGNRPGDTGRRKEEAANRLDYYFFALSQSVQPLEETKFHPALRLELQESRRNQTKPRITKHQVYCKMIKATKPHSSVPGDVPLPVIKCYPYLYSAPVAKIFNKIINTSTWLQRWKEEQIVVLPKSPNLVVKSEEDLRNIAKSPWISKLLENLLLDFILPILNPYLDPGQCGGLNGSSTTHYLVKLLDFVHRTLDKRMPHCAVLATEDLSWAYNLGNHSLVVEDLFSMHLPGWLLAITCSYLSGRTRVLQYQGSKSSSQQLPGGFGAGNAFGGIFFIIKFNGVCIPIPRPMSGNQSF